MTIREFQEPESDDRDKAQLAQAIKAFTLALEKNPVLDGRLVEGAELTTTATAINHKLGRVPLGWIITNLDSEETVYRTAWDKRTLSLIASASCTADIWVF